VVLPSAFADTFRHFQPLLCYTNIKLPVWNLLRHVFRYHWLTYRTGVIRKAIHL